MKEVTINIKGLQADPSETEPDSIEFTTEGKYGVKDGSYYLSYDESEFMGLAGVRTSLYVKSDNTVILQRTGALESRLVVQEGIRNNCFYQTSEGQLLIGIFGETVENRLSGRGGSIKMKYTIDSNLNLISRNEVNISVKEVKKDVNTCC